MPPDWNASHAVAFFRDRPPDHRLVALHESGGVPCGARVLDVGCAGGRNAAYLSAFDVHVDAVDASPAMVAATRERLAAYVGPAEAAARVRLGRVDALDALPAAAYDLVLALGVLQHAGDDAAFAAAVAHVARVTRPGGSVLVAHFSPASQRPLALVPGSRHMYVGFHDDDPAAPLVMHDAAALDAAFSAHGFAPLHPTETVVAAGGSRVTINAHYLRLVRS